MDIKRIIKDFLKFFLSVILGLLTFAVTTYGVVFLLESGGSLQGWNGFGVVQVPIFTGIFSIFMGFFYHHLMTRNKK